MKPDVETLISDLIRKTLEVKRKPARIWLTDERYQELCVRLSRKLPRFEVFSEGIIYHEYVPITCIDEYKGIPIAKGCMKIIEFEKP